MFKPFTLPGRIRFYAGHGQLPECELTGPGGRVRVSLQGAQVLSYQPEQADDLLWVSPNARFQQGKAIRGGIPVCWPWFGDHPDNTDLPTHGFARTSLWEVRSSFADTELTRLQLGLTESATTQALWPGNFDLLLDIELGSRLSLELTTRNTGSRTLTLTEALHTYYAVGAVDQTRIAGLKNCRYRDKLEGFAVKTQSEELQPSPPLDRVYDHSSDLLLTDPVLDRSIRIDKDASYSTIVWNPGAQAAANLADIGADAAAHFICIEAGNALDRAIRLAPGESHTLRMSLSADSNPAG